MIKLGIDQMTVVLFPNHFLIENPNVRWNDIALNLVFEVESKLHLVELLGERKFADKGINGYGIGFWYGTNEFFFGVYFNNVNMNMGVMIKFSAQALAYYTNLTGLEPYQILQKMQSPLYTVRCSRVDIAFDFIDESVSINEIYQAYSNKMMRIYQLREHLGKIEKHLTDYYFTAIFKNSECATIYFGKRASNILLRIYNKKNEQIENHGTRLREAQQCEEWTRFEIEAKSSFAHELTHDMIAIQDEISFQRLLLDFFIQRFYFVTIHKDTEYTASFTEKIENLKNDNTLRIFKASENRNTELERSIIYIIKTSGTVSTFYKVLNIWGWDGLKALIEILKYYTKKHKPNYTTRSFLSNNRDSYRESFSDFNTYFKSEVLPELKKLEGEETNE